MMLGPLGAGEILLIVLILILLFGAKRIPDLMRSLGEGMREFKKASRGLTEESAPKEKTESERLREAAAALGIPTEGKTDEEIRKEVSARVAG